MTSSSKEEQVAPFRAFVNRDYSNGTEPRFEVEPLPAKLQGILSPEIFKATIETINSFFEDAERHTRALYWRNFANCLFGYVADFCLPNPYNAHLDRMSAFVDEQNSTVYNPRGLLLVNPLDRGLRVIEITNLPGGSRPFIMKKTSF